MGEMMKIRTLFMLVALVTCLLSMTATLVFFNAMVKKNIREHLTIQARNICSLLSLYQNQCRSTLSTDPQGQSVHIENILAAATERLSVGDQDNLHIRYSAYFPQNTQHLPLEQDASLFDLFGQNPKMTEYSEMMVEPVRALRYVQPIDYQEFCFDCHHDAKPDPGEAVSPALLIVDIPYASFSGKQHDKLSVLGMINFAGYFMTFLILIALLKSTVLKKLKKLESAALCLEQGNYDQAAFSYHKKAKNELDVLANAFYEMKNAVENREKSLMDKRRQIYSMFHHHQSIMLLVDAVNYLVLDANVAAEHFYGMSEESLKSKSFYGLHSLSRENLTHFLTPCLEEQQNFVEIPYQDVGEARCLELRLSPVDVDQKACLFLIIHDITAQKNAREQIKKEHQFFQTVIDNMVDPVLVLDTERHIKKANRAAKALANGKLEENADLRCYQAFQSANIPCDYNSLSCPMHIVLKTGKPVSVVRFIESKNKTYEIQASPYFDEVGNISGIIESFRDITQRLEVENSLIENERKIYDLTHYDDLTGLPNRSVLIDRLNQAIYHALYKNKTLALLCLNLDRFKKINDTLGHHVGDKLLQKIAQRLQSFQNDHTTLARCSGSEFFLLLEDTQNVTVTEIAKKISSTIKESFFTDGHELIPSCSIGIAFFPQHAESSMALMAKADIAMRISKDDLGGDSLTVYEQSLDKIAPESLRLEANLKRAIEGNELYLEYQPQFSLKDGTLIGLEALVRWHHPKEGVISPAAFIPLAEETGLIHDLGFWVLKQACRQITLWQKDGVEVVPVAVNVSSMQMKKANFIHLLDQCLEEFNLDPDLLELEITESAIMDRLEASMETLRSIRSRGFKLAIDDFGTGYSSLSYLKSFPFSKLKVDRSFVMDLENDENDAAIIAAIISMAKSLGLNTIAEGVENNYQRDFLIKHGCDEVQGFLYSRPLSAEDIFRNYLVRTERPE